MKGTNSHEILISFYPNLTFSFSPNFQGLEPTATQYKFFPDIKDKGILKDPL